jgi:hypothetical protein
MFITNMDNEVDIGGVLETMKKKVIGVAGDRTLGFSQVSNG